MHDAGGGAAARRGRDVSIQSVRVHYADADVQQLRLAAPGCAMV